MLAAFRGGSGPDGGLSRGVASLQHEESAGGAAPRSIPTPTDPASQQRLASLELVLSNLPAHVPAERVTAPVCTSIGDLLQALLQPGVSDPERHRGIALSWVMVLMWILSFSREVGSTSTQMREAVGAMVRGSSVHSVLSNLAGKARELEFRSGAFPLGPGGVGGGRPRPSSGSFGPSSVPTGAGTCHFCKRMGHYARDCPDKQQARRDDGPGGSGGAGGGGSGRLALPPAPVGKFGA